MRHFLSGIAITAAILSGGPAAMAQNPFEPIVYVNNLAVTRYELNQRITFLQLLRAPGADAESAERELVNDRLKLQAAEAMGMEITDEAMQAGLAEFAGRANMSPDQFVAALGEAGVEPQTYRDFVRAGIAWRELVRARVVPNIDVSDAEIDQALKEIVETPIVDRVLLSEIIIPTEGNEDAAMARAAEIAGSNPSEAAFSEAARRYSASGSASQGGRLDWVALDNLPPSLRPIVTSLSPGQVTQPLNVPGAVVLFMLRDSQGQLRPGATEQVLDYAVLRLADRQAAANVQSRVDTCDDLQAEGAGATQRQTVSQNAIPGQFSTQLASLDDNEIAVMNMGGAVDLVMLCSRQPALLADANANVAVTTAEPDGVEDGVPQTPRTPQPPAGMLPGSAAATVTTPQATPDAEAVAQAQAEAEAQAAQQQQQAAAQQAQAPAAPVEPEVAPLPDREGVRDQLFNRKINAMAEAYLAELRADAVIRRP